jgi:hypothetical protein
MKLAVRIVTVGIAVFLSPHASAEDLWGYIDSSGKIVIKPQFQWAMDFKDGFARVALKPDELEKDAATINRRGQVVPALAHAYDFSEALAAVHSGTGDFNDPVAGYCNYSGRLVIKGPFKTATRFINGKALVEGLDDRVRVIDHSGNVVASLPEGVHLPWRTSGIPFAVVVDKNPKPKVGIADTGVANFAGQVCFKLPGEMYSCDDFQDGLGKVKQMDYPERFGFVDDRGVFVIQPKWLGASDFCEGLAAVRQRKTILPAKHYYEGEWCYINKRGETQIKLPASCSYAQSFSEGLGAIAVGGEPDHPRCFVSSPGVYNNALWGFVDHAGRILIKPQFPATNEQLVFHEGLCRVPVGDQTMPKWGFIDKHGSMVVHPVFKHVSDFSDGLAAVCVGNVVFDEREWRKKRTQADGYDLVEQFLKFADQKEFFGMPRSSLHAALGKPEQASGNAETYLLSWIPQIYSPTSVEIEYQSDKVYRYRLFGRDQEGPWVYRGSSWKPEPLDIFPPVN